MVLQSSSGNKFGQINQTSSVDFYPLKQEEQSTKPDDYQLLIKHESSASETRQQSCESDKKRDQRDNKYSSQMSKRKVNALSTDIHLLSQDSDETASKQLIHGDSHTDKKTTSRLKRDRKVAISISNKDSKSLSMASQAKFDRKKFLGDLVANKINSSHEFTQAPKQTYLGKDQKNASMRNTYCNLMHNQRSRTDLSTQSQKSLEHHAVYPYNYPQKLEVKLDKPTALNKTFFKGSRYRSTKKIDTFFISAAPLENTRTSSLVPKTNPVDVPLSLMLKQYGMVLKSRKVSNEYQSIVKAKRRNISIPKKAPR